MLLKCKSCNFLGSGYMFPKAKKINILWLDSLILSCPSYSKCLPIYSYRIPGMTHFNDIFEILFTLSLKFSQVITVSSSCKKYSCVICFFLYLGHFYFILFLKGEGPFPTIQCKLALFSYSPPTFDFWCIYSRCHY